MEKTLYFAGNPTVGAYVQRMLEPLGWQRVDDLNGARLVVTYFAFSSALEDAYLGEDGIVRNADAGALVIDLSPSTPALLSDLAAVALVNDLAFVEAPLVVLDPVAADAFADAGSIAVYAASEDGDVGFAEDVLSALASRVETTGSFGSAQLMKAAQTVRAAAEVASAVEADALVRSVGRDSLAGVKPHLGEMRLVAEPSRFQEAFDEARFAGTYTVEMFMGEVAAAMTAADDADVILPQLESIMHLLEILAVVGGASLSPAALTLVYRGEEAGKAVGLDWSRADGLFADQHSHDDYGDDLYDELDEYDDLDDFGDLYGDAFSPYSSN